MTKSAQKVKPQSPIEAMKLLKVYPSPQNYELFFSYCEGNRPLLSKDLEPFFDGTQKWTGATATALYNRHITDNKLSKILNTTSETVGSELRSAIEVLTQAGKDAAVYEETLVGAGGSLQDITDPGSIRQIVDHLVKATQDMHQRSHNLEQKLSKTNQQIETLQTNLDQVKIEAMTDSLSGLSNRKRFDEVLADEAERAVVSGAPMALVLCDIDHFKRFNDTWGHQTGDQIIRFVSSTLKRSVADHQLAARYGGEEFALIMPATDLSKAVETAERVRKAIERKKLVRKSTNENLGKVTISMGVSLFRHSDEVEDIIERADKALYQSKQNGRNRVSIEDGMQIDAAA